jgi:hypothetical protein
MECVSTGPELLRNTLSLSIIYAHRELTHKIALKMNEMIVSGWSLWDVFEGRRDSQLRNYDAP